MGEDSITLGELVALTAYLGAPAFLLVIAIQIFALRYLLQRSLGPVQATVCIIATLALSLPLSIAAWIQAPQVVSERYVQLLNFLFLPALIGGAAAATTTGLVTYLLLRRAA